MKANSTIQRQKPEEPSGFITLEGMKVIWHNDDIVFTSFDLSEIAIIGEHTNSNGPWFDDWFIDFVKKDGSWSSISWYADNIEELTEYLSKNFQKDFYSSYLTNSTSWNSVVRYPDPLKGKPLFTIIPTKSYKEPKTFLGKILHGCGWGKFDTTKVIRLSQEVENELKNIMDFPLLKDNQFAVGKAAYDTGHVLRNDLTLFHNGESTNDMYEIFESYEEAAKYALQRIIEHPEIECWIVDNKNKHIVTYYKDGERR